MPHYSASLLALHESLHCFPPIYRQLDGGGAVLELGAHGTWVQQVHASCDVQCQHICNRCAFWYFPCPPHKCAVNLCHLSGKWSRNLSDNHQFMNDGQKKTQRGRSQAHWLPSGIAIPWCHCLVTRGSHCSLVFLIPFVFYLYSSFFTFSCFLPISMPGLVYFTTLQLVERHFNKSLAI